MLYQYELVIIFTPILSDTELKNIMKEYESFMKDNGGEIVHKETWGLKQLAYEIDKKTTGIYGLWQFKGPGDLIQKLEILFKRDDNVMRHLITKLDKYAIEYAESRRKRLKEKKSKDEAEARSEDQKVKEEA